MQISPRARILPPYVRRVEDTRHKVLRVLLGVALVTFSMFMGLLIAVFGLPGWSMYAMPLVALFLLALWIAPDLDTDLDRTIRRGHFAVIAFFMIWPSYIALDLPGVPWISFERLIMFALAAITLYALATSSRLRGEFAEVLQADTGFFRAFLIWTVIQLAMVAVAQFQTAGRFVNYLLFWNFLLMLTAWLVSKPGYARKLFWLLLIANALQAIFALLELHNGKPIWTDYIPPFLGIDPTIMEKLHFGYVRSGELRVKSIFLTSTGYAEFIGMAAPLALWAVLHAPNVRRFLAAIALLYLLFYAGLLTQARTAMVGFTIAVPVFMALWVVRRYIRKGASQRDVLSSGMLWLAPAGLAVFAAAIMFIPRLRVRVLGGSQHRKSNAGREAQWDMAIPKIFENPLGYGVDKIESAVPFYNWAGVFTIDSYPIILLIEYGVLGFLAYIVMFGAAVYLGARTYVLGESREELLAGAFAVSILCYMVSRVVVATGPAPTLAFAYAGIVLGLWWRHRQRVPKPPPKPAVEPLYRLPPRRVAALARQV